MAMLAQARSSIAGFVIGLFAASINRFEDQLHSSECSVKNTPTTDATSLFKFSPSVKEVVINVGSNLDPIMPTYEMGPCAHAIAIEPIVGCKIPSHRQLSVIHAAVSDKPGVMSMEIFNTNGVSSSLAAPAKTDFWNSNKARGDGKTAFIPIITLSSVLNAIPSTVKISLIKTDMQGFDFVSIKEAASVIKEKVTHLYTEVWFDDTYTYQAENDFCRDWLPFMTELGYGLVRTNGKGDNVEKIKAMCAKQVAGRPQRPAMNESAGLNEGDAFWVRLDAAGIPFPKCREINNLAGKFSKEEYATCDTV